MRINDLMYGDIVLQQSDDGSIVPLKVFGLEYVAWCAQQNDDGWEDGCDGYEYNDLKPMPFTKDILLKNGWTFDASRFYIYPNKPHTTIVRFCEDDENINEHFLNKWFFDENYMFTNVHEFQHLLRVAGLNEMANDLKI